MFSDAIVRSGGDASARERLSWAPDIPVHHVSVDGAGIRYIAVGSGPTLLLLHTLRTQLDMFQKIIPELAQRFRVYALDYPGHGHSDSPDADYAAGFFVATVAGFMDRLDLRDATVAGESIGGAIALLLAARHDSRVRRVVAINPYDYDRGRGLRRSSALANVVLGLGSIPVVGEVVMRMGTFPVAKRIFEGGVYRKDSFPPPLLRELYIHGKDPGRLRAFLRLVRQWPSWEAARIEYANIAVPVLLVYGDHDWSRTAEREADRRAIPGAEMQVVEHAGHFLALDAPVAVARAIDDFAAGDIRAN